MSPLPVALTRAIRLAGLLGLALVAAGVAQVAYRLNLAEACRRDEWPHFSVCPARDLTVAGQVRELRSRAWANPGDSNAYVALALLSEQSEGIAPLDAAAIRLAAETLALSEPLLQQMLARRVVAERRWHEAVPRLVRLVEVHRDEKAVRTLAALLAEPQALPHLVQALKPGSRWLPSVLRALGERHLPVEPAMALLGPGLAMSLIPPETGLQFVARLRASGHWLEAHALWLKLLGRPMPLVFNGEFEEGFVRGGFDWEVQDVPPSRAGVRPLQSFVSGATGRALELSFNGRPILQPLIRQLLVAWPGRYTLTGRYFTRALRVGAGLVWTLTCTQSRTEIARTPPVADSQGRWRSFATAVVVPEGCGAIALQLVTDAAADALTGGRGEAFFDDIRLTEERPAP